MACRPRQKGQQTDGLRLGVGRRSGGVASCLSSNGGRRLLLSTKEADGRESRGTSVCCSSSGSATDAQAARRPPAVEQRKSLLEPWPVRSRLADAPGSRPPMPQSSPAPVPLEEAS